MDTAPSDANKRARDAVDGLGEGIELRRLRLRESGGRYFADAVVGVAPGQAVVEGHVTADSVEDAIRGALPESDVVVHLEPRSENLDLRERAQAAALAEPLVREVHDITLYESNGHVNLSLHLKLAPDLPLRKAHEAAERVEKAIEAVPEVESVQTHLEPIEQPQSAAVRGREGAEDADRMRELVATLTGREPLELQSSMRTDRGPGRLSHSSRWGSGRGPCLEGARARGGTPRKEEILYAHSLTWSMSWCTPNRRRTDLAPRLPSSRRAPDGPLGVRYRTPRLMW